MKILVIGSQLLFPANTGGRIRTSKLFEKLARQHDITWLCLRRPEETDAQEAEMRTCAARVETFLFDEIPRFSPRFYWDLAKNLASPLPFVVRKYYHPGLRARVAELLEKEPFDLLICDFLQPSLNVIDLPFRPRVLFQHNVESVIFERHYRESRHPAARAYLYLQWRKLLAYEGRAARWFDHNIMVSPNDCETMHRLYGVDNTSFIPSGVDADYYQPGAGESEGLDLVFTGSMDWLPNVDGVQFFAAEILPRIVREMPIKLWVVGRKPLPAVEALAARHPEIVVTGTVDDVRPYVQRARVCVVPLRIGGGTRVKIFEAMAMGKAVVSTRVGAEGLPVTDGQDIVLADDPAEFAQRILELLRDDGRRRSIAEAGRRLVTQVHTWDAVARRFSEICQGVVAQSRGIAAGSSGWQAAGVGGTP
jgi:polysaccharide biosynthesis protein PslH